MHSATSCLPFTIRTSRDCVLYSRSEPGRSSLHGTVIRASRPYPRGPRSSQGYAVPVHPRLLTSSEPLMDTPRFPGHSGYTESQCCAGAPRPPTSGSELSLLILVGMLSSSTTENSPVACAQFLHWRHGLHLHETDSAFSTPPP